ncbi:MAG TPA: FtsQ-type POTRA domain-containing protein [Victivallales bacterium]|mgnify:CR=1 FL=1|nr:FtsQ-type POTRA domain-containing protein [Victivallales bacterium]
MLDNIRRSPLFKKTHVRLGISISILMSIAVMSFLAFSFATRSLFSANKHFTIKKIVINGTASWKAREKQILDYGGIKKGVSNIFNVNLRELRAKIDALPSVEKSTISRKLPNTLVINISERIPRAAFNKDRKRWYTDDYGIVFSASSYGEIRHDLPIIVGFTPAPDINEGDCIPEFKFPATIVTVANRLFPEFIPIILDVREPKFVVAKIRPVDGTDTYTVIFPKIKLEEKFAAFKWAYKKSIEDNTNKKIFDLRFEGQVVTR